MAGLVAAVALVIARWKAAADTEKDALRRMEGDHSNMYFERVKEWENAHAEAENLTSLRVQAEDLHRKHLKRSGNLMGARKGAETNKRNRTWREW
jgi:hypothetical protein